MTSKPPRPHPAAPERLVRHHPSPPLAGALLAGALLLAGPALAPEATGRLTAQSAGMAGDARTAEGRFDPALFGGLEYRMVGPARGGRVTAVAGHPSHPRTFYMGATGGGVWKTTDAGHSWEPISDDAFATPSIGAIRVAPSDPDVVYVGTGSDGIRSNIISGKGMYGSRDAGETWEFLGLEEAGQIGSVLIHPEDPDLVYAAALGHPFGKNEERGVFRSSDGGDTWENVLFVNDSTGAVDLEFQPGNPEVIYAAMWRAERRPWTIISGGGPDSGDGIWKTTDGGESWHRVGEGLPEGLIGKVDFAVSPADPDRVYALVEAVPEEEGLYRSDDAGESWRLVNDDENGQLMHRPFYFTNVDADPTDADVVYVSSLLFWKSVDGGETFDRIPTTHADNHDLWINPDDPDVMIQSNDGGASVTLDGGETWSSIENQPTAELYQVDVDDRFPYWLYAGQQDNSTIAVPSRPPAESAPAGPIGWWKAIGGCETGPAVPKPGDPSVVFANCKGRFGRYSTVTGQEQGYWVGAQYMYGRNPAELDYRFQRTVPIEVSPHDPDVVYHGSQYVHRTRDGGVTWERISPDLTAFRPERQVVSGAPITRDVTGEEHYSTLYVIEESQVEPGVIWAGANDGPVHVTRDGGGTWTDVTPPEMPPEGRVNAIQPSPHAPGKAYVAIYRYLLDDWAPYIWRTTDYGESWTLLTDGTNGIPADWPARVVREDPEREGLLYAGTEWGVFVSFDDGARWQPLQRNLPVVPITDIEVVDGDLALSTMGRSFWIMHDIAPLRQLDDRVATSGHHFFQPADAHRMRYNTFFGYGPGPSAAPDYPPSGANLDYWLAEAPSGTLTLEIADASGEVIRTFETEPRHEDEAEEGEGEGPVGMGGFGPSGRGGPELPRSAGAHRFTWDLEHPGPWSESGRRGGGPLVAPGTYTATLSAEGWSETRTFEVRIDPRVAEIGVTVADLEEQERLNLDIVGALSDARRAAFALDSLRDLLEPAEGEEPSDAARSLLADVEALEAELVTSDYGSYPPPMLIDQIQYLYGMTTDADQKLGRDAFTRYETLRGELDGRLDELASLRERADAVLGAGAETGPGR